MSRYEWEHGTFKLPTAEFSKLRKKVEQAANARQRQVFDHTQTFWKGLSAKQKRDHAEYRRALDDYTRAIGQRTPQRPSYERDDTSLSEEVYWALDMSEPRRVLKSDMKFPTNRTTTFEVGFEGSISFDRDDSTVTWSVAENNHAVEDARQHELAGKFFSALRNVRWSRNTGGVIVGNDEYNQDSYNQGGGGNYETFAIGPIGEERAPMSCVSYLDSKGRKRHNRDIVNDMFNRQRKARGQGQGRVRAGVPSGGQFSGRYHSEAEAHL